MSKIMKSNVKRERISRSLHKLKNLIQDYKIENNENISKVNNSDILELAVEHIRKTCVSSFETNFVRGFVNATNEVSFALSHLPQIDKSSGNKILAHLENQLTNNPHKAVYPLMSPTSSGYGSENESICSDVWRPW